MSHWVKSITGDVVEDWTEFGHHFQIERLPEPVRVGASERSYRLWDNGHPATGGQWHYDIDGAKSRAEYVLSCSYSDRISFLEKEVNTLRRQNDKRALWEFVDSLARTGFGDWKRDARELLDRLGTPTGEYDRVYNTCTKCLQLKSHCECEFLQI